MPLYAEKDKTSIPESMDEKLSKYNPGDEIEGKISFTIDKKDKDSVRLCINSFSCRPQVRMMGKQESY